MELTLIMTSTHTCQPKLFNSIDLHKKIYCHANVTKKSQLIDMDSKLGIFGGDIEKVGVGDILGMKN